MHLFIGLAAQNCGLDYSPVGHSLVRINALAELRPVATSAGFWKFSWIPQPTTSCTWPLSIFACGRTWPTSSMHHQNRSMFNSSN